MLIDEIDAEVEALVHASMPDIVGLSFEVLRRRHGNPVLSWNLSVAINGYRVAIERYTDLKIQLHRVKKRDDAWRVTSPRVQSLIFSLQQRVEQARRWKNKIKERILELTDNDHGLVKDLQKPSGLNYAC